MDLEKGRSDSTQAYLIVVDRRADFSRKPIMQALLLGAQGHVTVEARLLNETILCHRGPERSEPALQRYPEAFEE